MARSARWLLVLAYAWSAGGKLFWPGRLRGILQSTGMIPAEFVRPVAHGLPALELLLALALAAGVFLPSLLLASILLSTTFVGTHAYLLASGDLVACGCVGVAVDFSSWEWHLFMLCLSIGMAVASVALLFTLPPRKTPKRGLRAENAAEPTAIARVGAQSASGALGGNVVASGPPATGSNANSVH